MGGLELQFQNKFKALETEMIQISIDVDKKIEAHVLSTGKTLEIQSNQFLEINSQLQSIIA